MEETAWLQAIDRASGVRPRSRPRSGPRSDGATQMARQWRRAPADRGMMRQWHDARRESEWPAIWMDGMDGDRLTVNGIELEVLRRGADRSPDRSPDRSMGRPVLLLHGMDTVHSNARFLDLLESEAEVIAPSSPGFGNT